MNLDEGYELIPLSEITNEAREIAVRWGDEYFPGIALQEKHKLASDIMNYAKKYFEAERDNLIKEILKSVKLK